MNRKETALQTFENGFNCCQAVLSAFYEAYALERATALKIAAGFGGGLRRGEVCGAVAGAVMVLGLQYGHCEEGDNTAKLRANAKTVEFIKRFEKRNGTILCRKLLGYDISDEQQHKQAAEKGVFSTVCPRIIEEAVVILGEMLEQ